MALSNMVISAPFCVYVDGLLSALKSAGYGCYIGHYVYWRSYLRRGPSAPGSNTACYAMYA